MQEVALQVIDYLKANPVLALSTAVIAGVAASKSVAHDQGGGIIVYFAVGLVGFFLGELMIFYFGFQEYLEKISEFRFLFDLVAAYVGSFVVAATLHFVNPM